MPIRHVTIASYNIHYGYGLDGTYDLKRIAREIGDADIACVQEITQGIVNGDDQVRILADLLGLYAAHHPGVSLAEAGTDRLARRTFGNAILSRWPITTSSAVALPGPRPDGPDDLERSAMSCIINIPDNTAIRVVTTHLTHQASALRLEQIDGLMTYIGSEADKVPIAGSFEFLPDSPSPTMQQPAFTVLAGDFNCEPHSDEYAALLAGYPTMGGQLITLRDLHRDVDRPYTYHNPRKHARAVFDYLLTDTNNPRHSWIDHNANGSDHQPIFSKIELTCPP